MLLKYLPPKYCARCKGRQRQEFYLKMWLLRKIAHMNHYGTLENSYVSTVDLFESIIIVKEGQIWAGEGQTRWRNFQEGLTLTTWGIGKFVFFHSTACTYFQDVTLGYFDFFKVPDNYSEIIHSWQEKKITAKKALHLLGISKSAYYNLVSKI